MIPFRERRFVAVLLFVGAGVSIISSLGAPLIPTIAEDLHTGVSTAQWSLTATLLVAAVASPLVGRLGDGRHRKAVIVFCLGAVVVGGVFAALSTSLALLVLGRAMQGMGLALMPLTMAAAREHLPAERSRGVIAGLSVVGAAGVGLGYPITGLIAGQLDVSAAFWFGVLVSGVALVASILFIPRAEQPPARLDLDLPGAAIIALALVALLLGLEKAPEWGWGAPRTLLLLAVGAVLALAWGWHELRIEHPLVDLRLMRHRAVLTANVAGFALGITMYMSLVEVSQFVQVPGIGFGETVFVAGLTLVPLSVCSWLSSRTLPFLTARIGMRPIIPMGSMAVALSALFFAVAHDALWQAFVAMGLLGLGMGYTFAAMPTLIVGAIPRRETGSAMGFYQVSRMIGFSIGSGLVITLLRAFGDDGVPTAAAYSTTSLVAMGLALAAALIAWILPGRAVADAPRRPLPPAAQERATEEALLAVAGLENLEDVQQDGAGHVTASRHG